MKKNIFKLLLLLPLLSSCVHRHYEVSDYRLRMEFHDDFKIMQITDLHFGIESDLQSQFDFVRRNIYEANPDLIILTGDNFMYASKAIVDNTYAFINDCCRQLTSNNNKISKFAVTYGNHDNQGDYSFYYLNESLSNFVTSNGKEIEDNKYALFVDYKDDDIFGYANYFIDLVNKNDEDDILYRLHIIDSNTYVSKGIKYGYDVIHEDQLEHINNIYNEATSDKDYLGLAFFHIPLLNFKDAIEQYYSSSDPTSIGQGSFLDKEHFPYEDNGSYQMMKDSNIIGYFTGHDHKNYGDILYLDEEGDKALFSYGVKSSNQLYHSDDAIGYKLINLKEDITKDEFLSMEYVSNNIINVIDKGGLYD